MEKLGAVCAAHTWSNATAPRFWRNHLLPASRAVAAQWPRVFATCQIFRNYLWPVSCF